MGRDRPGPRRQRTASFTDPGGHIWEIAQDPAHADGS